MQDDSTASGVPKDFVHRLLPWVVAAMALVVYGVSIDQWPTYNGLPTLARVAGWDWRPSIYGPVYFLTTYPVRWLPGAWQVVSLKLFSGACSALTLALLARSVSLLPHDRTRDQRSLERSDYSLLSLRTAWLPPILAALVCGLQMSFWENAVAATAEALDLLLFAYVIRCLLEFRIDQRESWLAKAVFVYSLGMTNNFAMVGFLPVWLVAFLWVKGRSFFNWRFLLRMVGIGMAGLLFYALMPALASLSGLLDQDFWQLLRSVWGFQKNVLLSVPRYIILLMGLTSLAPVLFMGIRWPAQFGDISAAGNYLTNLMTHVIHGIFLAACLYVAFDPPFSPRQLSGGVFAYLPFYYLGALAVGYCSGYFLLVFGRRPETKAWQRVPILRQVLNAALVAAVWAAFLAAPVGLVWKNFRELGAAQARELAELSRASAQQLPPRAAVLSDDTFRLYALQAALGQTGTGRDLMLIDTSALQKPAYHQWLRQRYPDWPKLPEQGSRRVVGSSTLLPMIDELVAKRPLYYLEPTFGYYMEQFYQKPRGPVFEMVRLPTNAVSPPPMTLAELQPTVDFWTKFKADHLGAIIKARKSAPPPKAPKGQGKPVSRQTLYAASIFSRGLNTVGVELEKAGALEKAADFFQAALQLDPQNPCAYINQEFNAARRGKGSPGTGPSDGVISRLGPYGGNWDAILSISGPVDEPNTLVILSRTFSANSLHRQAAQSLERALALTPGDPAVRLALANAYAAARFPDKALELVAALRAQFPTNTMLPRVDVALSQAEAWAHVARNEVPTAEKLLLAAQQKYPQEPGAFGALVEIYRSLGRYKDAIQLLERQLKSQPNNVNALVNLGALDMNEGAHEKAVPLLDRALMLQPANDGARFNRAVAHLTLKQLDPAQRDYEALLNTAKTPDPAIHYGLAEVYAAKKLPKKAVEQYEMYLKLAPPDTPEAKYVRDRLKALK